ncbi:hypothetical protein [uncultured Winogradskyella sp.]|uniref:hypothetical protein n=1 Tax=uncultured Winogradskyella sp. TaxID=395353 RepID=UPI00262F032C|nr:hypothetical protein [uncultured Winogradskyella sp.]|tara:strand:+ start:1969 stop:2400 length:432 start_codon:yes stop_codon:yes gene_type:complete
MKLSKLFMFSLICLLFLNTQCEDENTFTEMSCGLEIEIDTTAYEDAESQTIDEAIIDGDCVIITILSSGCDSANWVMTLIDSEAVAESLPPQRYLKLSLFNNEVCLAFLSKQEYFDLTPLRVEGLNEVLLNIEGLAEPLLYSY